MEVCLRFIVLLLFPCFFSGCSSNQTTKDIWKYTQKQYRSYLNTPASIDLEAKGSGSEYALALSAAVREVDNELDALVRVMENSGRNVDPDWVYTSSRRLPWLSGIALVDNAGGLLSHYPDFSSAEFDAEPLLHEDLKKPMSQLRAYVQTRADGPHIYVGNPVFAGETMQGMVVAHFDPRSLLMKSPNPGSFAIVSPTGVIWLGDFGGALVGENWNELLKKESSGLIGSHGHGYYWVSRYLGNLPLIYVISENTGNPASQDTGKTGLEPVQE